jgi:hypothetical protein
MNLMENEIKDIISQKDQNKFDKEQKDMKNEIININEFHFSFENKNEINYTNNILPHISENENEKIENAEPNDFEDDNKEENSVFEAILNDLNKNIEINIKELENENKNYRECQEILEILKYPLSDKNIRNGISPFKPLLKPKKVSLIGKVLCDIHIDNNSHNNSTENTSSNVNNNGKIL